MTMRFSSLAQDLFHTLRSSLRKRDMFFQPQ
jgi:hypothetical protein